MGETSNMLEQLLIIAGNANQFQLFKYFALAPILLSLSKGDNLRKLIGV